jgi:hypothetical protein
LSYSDSNKIHESNQEKILLSGINSILNEKSNKLQQENNFLKKSVNEKLFQINEIEQEKILQEKILSRKNSKNYSKIYLSLSIISFISLSGFFVLTFTTTESNNLQSSYVVENLRGDKIDTWKVWNLGDHTLNVNIINHANLSDEKLLIIKNVILSEKFQKIENSLTHSGPAKTFSTYYEGWAGAVNYIYSRNPSTLYNIPTTFNVFQSDDEKGDIIITLKNFRNTDGNTGFTRTVVEENQILKSYITIYDADSLSNAGLEIITRHEFGHALGLIHSTDLIDLMYPVISYDLPLISPCNVQSLELLYEGNIDTEIICEI